MTIKYVDGFEIRRTRMSNFNFYGSYGEYGCELIPKGEFWIEKEYRNETERILTHEKALSLLMRRMSFSKARKRINDRLNGIASSNELRPRDRTNQAHKWVGNLKRDNPTAWSFIDKRFLKRMSVISVNGEAVRKTLDVLFVLGGHRHVYDYISRDEIWIDAKQNPKEMKYTFFHELYEYQLMRKGMDYDSAHDFAIAFEKYLKRRDGAANYDFDAEENRNRK